MDRVDHERRVQEQAERAAGLIAKLEPEMNKAAVKLLRDLPGHNGGMMDCKKAWDEHGPNLKAAYMALLGKPFTRRLC